MRVKDALFMAGGPNFNAYLNLAHIFRTDPKTREVAMLTVDLSQALAERDRDNIVLQNKDRLVVHHIQEYRPKKSVTIEGEVLHPGQYPLTEGMTIRDLVFAAGNIKEEAYLDDAELTSMITDNGRGVKYEQKNLNLRGAFANDAGQNVHLQSYDRLFVKRIPDWRTERFVTVQGEVQFPGRYIVKKGERLSSLLERVGGYKDTAYLRGAFFTRERVLELQQKGLQDMADRMQQELLSDTGISAVSAEEVAAKKASGTKKFVESCGNSGHRPMTIHLAISACSRK
jgi:protein involved in polysaccharide export with SLBB domain